MANPSQPDRPVRIGFGPFEFDSARGELRKYGVRIRLQGQPLQILSLMLSRPADVISRDELHRLLWSGTTFVDFEQGLNAAVNKLRQALGDSAQQPRYVETVPGQGYRFVAPVHGVQPKAVLEMPMPEAPPAPVAAGPGTASRKRLAITVVGAGLLVAATAFVFRSQSPPQAPATAVRFRIAVPDDLKLSGSQTFSLSPNGTTLVYLARAGDGVLRLYAHALSELEPRLIPGTESYSDPAAFWSPDSRWIAFYSSEYLRKVDRSGSPPQVIARVPSTVLGGSWNQQGDIIFGAENTGLLRVSAEGGEPVPLTLRRAEKGDRVHGWPTFLPDGRHFVYSRLSSVPGSSGIQLRSIDQKPGDADLKRLVDTPFTGQFVPGPDGEGTLLFQREAAVWAQTFNLKRLELQGEPWKVAGEVGATRAFGFFSASWNGRLIHRSAVSEVGQFAWFDRRGQKLETLGEPFYLDAPPVLAPGGRQFALSRFDRGNADIWLHDLVRDVSQRVTTDPALDVSPIWTQDGRQLIFSSGRAGHYDLYRISPGMGSPEEVLYASKENKYPGSITADGRFLLYHSMVTGASQDILLLPLDGTASSRKPVPLIQGPANELQATLTSKGDWLAFTSDESGRAEIYVQPFVLPPGSGAGKVLVSKGGGSRPRWRSDGRELLYRAADGTLMSVVFASGDLRPGIPRALFRASGAYWDVSADGNRFLVNVPVQQSTQPFIGTINWAADRPH